MNKCHTCGKVVEFVDKRAITCRPCAEARHAAAPSPVAQAPAQSGEVARLVKEAKEAFNHFYLDVSDKSHRGMPSGASVHLAIDRLAALATKPLAAPVQPAEWQTPPASWRMLAKAAIDLLCAVDEKHDTQQPPHKYAVPYGAVNDLRRALGAATPPAHPVLAPVVREPLTEEQIMADAGTSLSERHPDWRHFFISGVRYAERFHGIQATTVEQSHG